MAEEQNLNQLLQIRREKLGCAAGSRERILSR